jgi:hypothetical protein
VILQARVWAHSVHRYAPSGAPRWERGFSGYVKATAAAVIARVATRAGLSLRIPLFEPCPQLLDVVQLRRGSGPGEPAQFGVRKAFLRSERHGRAH